ncbi:ATP-binding protein [Vibrio cholerae]|nr:ATP-binding protein [Vibrio cholerae]EJL7179060.1 ATP-binding protein [Vibrio cholerae]
MVMKISIYIRKNHAKRVKQWINEDGSILSHFDNEIIDMIKEMLGDIPSTFKVDLANICESHNLDDLIDEAKYKPKQQYSNDVKTKINLHYCAIVLRVCDLLNITNDRAPSFEMRLISPDNAISKGEWLKHNPVNVIRPKDKTDKDGKIDPELKPDTFEVLAYFKDETGFFNLMSYLEYARREINECYNQCVTINEKYSLTYHFPWRYIDDSSIETEGFDREQLLFTIDQTRILDLLIGHTLYNDSSVVLRELIQNSLDACSLKEYVLTKNGNNNYSGKIDIHVNDNIDEVTITDNGVGMTIDIIKNHLLKVGSSRYQDPKFIEKHEGFNSISRFGIGLLTCFMISDDIDIMTKTAESDQGLLIKIRKVHGKYLLKNIKKSELPEEIKASGTKIFLKPRYDAREQCKKLHDSLKKWILIPKYKVTFHKSGKSEPIGYKDTKSYLNSLIEEHDIQASSELKVETEFRDGVELSYIVQYNKHFKQWEFFNYESSNNLDISGTCIEGVRIDTQSPGFKNNYMLSIANCTGAQAPRTNVARTNIENSDHKNHYLKKVYGIYINHISKELNRLCEDFSISWASRESKFLLSGLVRPRYARHRFRDEDSFFINESLFIEELSTLNVILQEDHQERKLISINELLKIGEFWTVDCESFSSADSLIKNVSSDVDSSSSLFVINSIQGGREKAKTEHINNLLCDLNDNNYDLIAKEVFNLFVVKEIRAFPELRRLDLRWGLNEDKPLWSLIAHEGEFRDDLRIHLQQSKDITLNRESEGNVIRSSGSIFILRDNEFHDYLQTLPFMNKNSQKLSNEESIVMTWLGKVIEFAFYMSNKTYENTESMINRVFVQSGGDSERRVEVFYSYFDKERLISSILNTSFINLDVNSWRIGFYSMR